MYINKGSKFPTHTAQIKTFNKFIIAFDKPNMSQKYIFFYTFFYTDM